MSNHFTGLSLGPPLGDQRLDLCDLYAFQSPADPSRTVIILNANPNADALHPDAIYRLNIDNDGDCLTDIAFSYVFSTPQNGKQTVNVFMAKGAESRSARSGRDEDRLGCRSLLRHQAQHRQRRATTRSSPAAAATRSSSTSTESRICSIPAASGISPRRTSAASRRGPAWIRTREANVFSTAIELPTSELGAKPEIRIWGRCSLRRDGKLLHVDRAGHPSSAASSTPTTPRRNTTPASRSTTGQGGSSSSST